MEFQRQYNKHGIQVNNALQTNGYAIDEEWCRFFKENHFLIGISVDGIRETHDAYRHNRSGQDTWERVVHTTELFDQYDVDYNILTVVNGKVAGHIQEIYEWYRERGWNFQQYIACLDPLEEERGQNIYALKPEQYGRFLNQLFDLWYEDWKKGEQPFIRQFENYVRILAGYPAEACDQRGTCGMQHVVEADGSVYPCDFYMLDEYQLGNLNEVQMDVIQEKRKQIGFIERSMKISDECRACKYFGICRGGCQRNRDYDKQSDTYQNYFCGSFQMFFEHCLERLQEIADSVK